MANVVKNLVVCVCLGIGTGGGILVGNELGAGALERAKRYGDKLCHFAIIAGTISGLVILFLMTGGAHDGYVDAFGSVLS